MQNTHTEEALFDFTAVGETAQHVRVHINLDECQSRKRKARLTAQLMSFIVSCGTHCSTQTTVTHMTDRNMSACRQLSFLVCLGLSTGLEIRLSQLDVPHTTHALTHALTHRHTHAQTPRDWASCKTIRA